MAYRHTHTCKVALLGTAALAATLAPIVARAEVVALPGTPTTALDPVNVNGVGLLATDLRPIFNDPNAVDLCTSTLINPRVVITAAHCFGAYGPPVAFGQSHGGLPSAVMFSNDNAARFFGLLNGSVQWNSNPETHLYEIDYVAYNPGFTPARAADVAIASFDTPVADIPTWALLFSRLPQPADGSNGTGYHTVLNGYGMFGSPVTGPQGMDFRRRAAANMVGALASPNRLFGPGAGLAQNLYWIDFDDPTRTNPFDFDALRDDAVPNEGMLSNFSSGSPLILDQAFAKPVVAGLASVPARFFAAQPPSTYGTLGGYTPLYLFWDWIAANNPYHYVGAKAGDGEWTDPGRWVSLADPGYQIIGPDGALVTGVPSAPGGGKTDGSGGFGFACVPAPVPCLNLATPVVPGTGTLPAATIDNGLPGATNFVPNNFVGDPVNRKPRYFDVTLSAVGTTRLASAVTIDRFTMNGAGAKLNVAAGGSLTSLLDYTQLSGWTQVDGVIRSPDVLVVTGLLSGTGTIDAGYLTVVGGVVSPGGADNLGTLTITGDVILAAGSALFVDAGRAGADRLQVGGALALDGGALVMNKAKGAAPKHGDRVTIATAAGGIDGQFGTIYAFQGVLRPELTYTANAVIAELRAGSLAQMIGQSGAIERAFAEALDRLRGNSYANLANLYGAIDLMGPQQLVASLQALAPTALFDSMALGQRQSRTTLGAFTDRLSGIAQGAAPQAFAPRSSLEALPSELNAQGVMPGGRVVRQLAPGVTMFSSSGGFGEAPRANGVAAERGRNSSMGLEMRVGNGLTLGSGFAYADGSTQRGFDQTHMRSRTAVVYGVADLGKRTYLGGLASAEFIDGSPMHFDPVAGLASSDDVRSRRNVAVVEAGHRMPAGAGFTVTPKASLRFDDYRLNGYRNAGAGEALEIEDYRRLGLEARVGVSLGGSTELFGWAISPSLEANAVHSLAGGNGQVGVRFAAAPDALIALPLSGTPQTWGELRGGFAATRGAATVQMGFAKSTASELGEDDRYLAAVGFRF